MLWGVNMQLWSFEHFITLVPSFLIMIVIGIVLKLLIGKKSFEIRMIPFKIVAVILVVIEILKQVISFIRGYDLYCIPLHFCSLFIFTIPLMAFYRGKYKDAVFAITPTLCFCLFLFLAIYPCLIYSSSNILNFFNGFFDFHTVAFHNLVLFEFVLIFTLKLHKPMKETYIKHLIFFIAVFVIFASTFAQVLKTNYTNFYHCNVGPVEQFRQYLINVLGYDIAQTLYVFVLSILHILFVMAIHYLYLFIQKNYYKIVRV